MTQSTATIFSKTMVVLKKAPAAANAGGGMCMAV